MQQSARSFICIIVLVTALTASARGQHVADEDEDVPQQQAALAQAAKHSASPQFKQAIQLVAKELGQEGKPDDEHKGIVYFESPAKQSEAALARLLPEIAKLKCSIVRCDMSHGIGGKPDVLALVGVAEPWPLMWIFGTNGINNELDTADIVKWMQQFAKDNDVTFDTIGFDLCGGRFTQPPKDYAALAKKIYEFCPDVVDQGTGSVEKLADEMKRTGRFFFWWD
jgi:hypothetical protein